MRFLADIIELFSFSLILTDAHSFKSSELEKLSQFFMGGTKMCNLFAQLKFDTGSVYSYKFRRINLIKMQRPCQLNEQLLYPVFFLYSCHILRYVKIKIFMR